MDYDRWDAILHHLFKQTHGDAWLKPEEPTTSGVAVRVNDDPPEFRVFPYENVSLEPFELAICHLNPLVAVKVRNAAVHAALSTVNPDENCIYVDKETRIQVLDTIHLLTDADREQCAAFIRDERVLVIWSDSLHDVVPTYQDLEKRLIKLLSRGVPHSTGTVTTTAATSSPRSRRSESLQQSHSSKQGVQDSQAQSKNPSGAESKSDSFVDGGLSELDQLEALASEKKRPIQRYAPLYTGLAAALAIVFMGNSINRLLQEWMLDGSFARFALLATIPFLFCIALFFAMQIMQNLVMMIGPVAHFHRNSKFYSAVKPAPNRFIDDNLPHITIQMPVYKESLENVLMPSIQSLKRAMQSYARQGGTSTLFLNDDGLRLLPIPERNERIKYYADQNIGWIARPRHDPAPSGFKRAGRFKKGSNMNYGLSLSLRVERHLERLMRELNIKAASERATKRSSGQSENGRYGMQYQFQEDSDSKATSPGTPTIDVAEYKRSKEEDLEERALEMAIDEMYHDSGRQYKPWAANGRAIRLGEIILLVDSDTSVPADCLRDAAREMGDSPTVAIIQHESEILQVANHYFENGMAYLTRRITRSISLACANGEVPPFVGHNAFLRWKALQDVAFADKDGVDKIWSESNVSEDFDIALRLLRKGWILRWATYSEGEFKEGVSLTIDDESNRWKKYAYGCSEIMFNSIRGWLKGPITREMHRFIWSDAPLHYKFSALAYMSSYYGIAASFMISLMNYILLGFQFPIDGFYMHSFEVWLASVVVFFASGSLGYGIFEYRVGKKRLIPSVAENLMWIPFLFVFFGGLSIPLTQAILSHLLCYNMTWSATVKEVQRSNFFHEIPKICKRFWLSFLLSTIVVAAMIILSTSLVPEEWHVGASAWGVIFPLSVVAGCHILFPIVLNPWLMVFSY